MNEIRGRFGTSIITGLSNKPPCNSHRTQLKCESYHPTPSGRSVGFFTNKAMTLRRQMSEIANRREGPNGCVRIERTISCWLADRRPGTVSQCLSLLRVSESSAGFSLQQYING